MPKIPGGYIETFDNTIYEGIIAKITKFGVSVEFSFGGKKFDGLLHYSKIPGGEDRKHMDICKVGDPIRVIATHVKNTALGLMLRLDCAEYKQSTQIRSTNHGN